jgi:hypothetical protein
VWSVVIVITSPSIQHRPYIIERRKLVHVQAFVSKSSVERRDEAILWSFQNSVDTLEQLEKQAGEVSNVPEIYTMERRPPAFE